MCPGPRVVDFEYAHPVVMYTPSNSTTSQVDLLHRHQHEGTRQARIRAAIAARNGSESLRELNHVSVFYLLTGYLLSLRCQSRLTCL